MNDIKGMQTQKPSILVIEDDEFTAALLRFVFERQQMQVTRVADGRSAMELIRDGHECDAVVLDWMLPQISGLEVLLQIQKHPGWASKPVLVLSAQDDGAQIARAFQAGAADYMTKPFNPEELLARLGRLIRNTERISSASRA
jgi:DNA-binding response OmpR family regulator